MLKKILFIIFVSFFIPSQQAKAWGFIGHKVVALIAQNHISEKTKKKIIEIIGEEVSLEDLAFCADEIKYNDYTCANLFKLKKQANTKPWHYIDIPVSTTPLENDLANYCKNDDCVINQLQIQINNLKDGNKTKNEKGIALMFLVHLAGDLHQPLHCVDDNDHGGNKKQIWFKNSEKKLNLHELWDNIIEINESKNQTEIENLENKLEKDISSKNTKSWLEGNINQWALESFSISKNIIYPNYNSNHGYLEDNYQEKMQPVAYEQLEKAGLRLAELLDNIYNN